MARGIGPGGAAVRAWCWVVLVAASAGGQSDYPIQPVSLAAVQVPDGFWAPRLATNRTTTILHVLRKCAETGRIDNFRRAAKQLPGPHQGYAFNDSDVFKVMEAAAHSLGSHPERELERQLDELIATVAAAQEPDGYLYTARTTDPDHPPEMCGPQRYSNLRWSHELYNIGHLYEAAVAHFDATGRRSLLEVALRSARHVAAEFGPRGRVDPPGHEELEIGLVKLYHATGEEQYLKLAQFFIECRGRNHDRRPSYTEYAQDHVPVTQQDSAVGHAVRAAYLYCGLADVAACAGEQEYSAALDRIWANMVTRRLYVTGGIGARPGGEAFGADYELPNATAYCETCAAIALALWSQRMFQLHGDARYVDVLERVLYNGCLSGVGLSGREFFYVNPLASDGQHRRQEWFDCACCPPNIARFLAALPGYVYARGAGAVYVNLFVASRASLAVGRQTIELQQETDYPWAGEVRIRVRAREPIDFTLALRVPGWAVGLPVPGDLYRFADGMAELPVLAVNGERRQLELERGYARLQRRWKTGDTVVLHMPMAVRRLHANGAVRENAGRVAIQRGPLVYCAEAVDNGGALGGLVIDDTVTFTPRHEPGLLDGVTVLRGIRSQPLASAPRGADAVADVVLVPYFAWAHREAGAMAVWLPRTADAVVPASRERP